MKKRPGMAHLRNIFAYFDSQKLIGEQKRLFFSSLQCLLFLLLLSVEEVFGAFLWPSSLRFCRHTLKLFSRNKLNATEIVCATSSPPRHFSYSFVSLSLSFSNLSSTSFTPTHPMLTHCQHVFRCLSLTLNINT